VPVHHALKRRAARKRHDPVSCPPPFQRARRVPHLRRRFLTVEDGNEHRPGAGDGRGTRPTVFGPRAGTPGRVRLRSDRVMAHLSRWLAGEGLDGLGGSRRRGLSAGCPASAAGSGAGHGDAGRLRPGRVRRAAGPGDAHLAGPARPAILSGSAFWTVARRRLCGHPCRSGSRILAGLAIEVRWTAALLVVRASLPALPAVSSRG